MNKKSPKSYLHNRLYENITTLKKRTKMKESNFNILEYKDYDNILK